MLDVVTLLGIELSNTENKQEIPTKQKDSNPSATLIPLLGTILLLTLERPPKALKGVEVFGVRKP